MTTKTTTLPTGDINKLTDQLTRTERQYANAKISEGAAKLAYSTQMRLLTASPIVVIKCQSNVVTYYTTAGTPTGYAPIPGLKPTDKDYPKIPYLAFVNANLNKNHWVDGLSDQKTGVYLNGVFSNPITYTSGDLRDTLAINQTRNNFSSVNVTGTIWSVKTGFSRKDVTSETWNNYLKAIDSKTKLTYQNMPTSNGVLAPNTETVTAPVSFNSTDANYYNADEVYWANQLYIYFKICKVYRANLGNKITLLKKAINQEAANLGSSKPIYTINKNKTTSTPSVTSSLGSQGVGDDTKPVIYNLPGPKIAYFRAGDFASEFIVSDRINASADAPTLVHAGAGLWNGSQVTINKKKHIERYNGIYAGGHKGMIQSYVVPGNFDGQSKFWNPNDKDPKIGFKGGLKSINKRRYGFQFLYNPSTISMHYAGAPQVDIGLEMSGADKVALIGSGVTSSTVSFTLLLNRMNDMRFVDDVINGRMFWKDIYSHGANHPEISTKQSEIDIPGVLDEVKAIQQKGTMYDIEYLLRTLIGYQLPSQLRGGSLTSDIGYLGAYPVELHLGKDMRYLVTIDSFDITHTIFTKDMIPVFTNLQITCNRLPEYNKNLNEITTRATTTNANDKGNN
jgi:hypothetical protein